MSGPDLSQGGPDQGVGEGPIFIRTTRDRSQPLRLDAAWSGAHLVLEDGTELAALDAHANLPADLPSGYHQLHADGPGADAASHLLVASPGICHRPDDLRAWGWAVQLYGARSSQSWGMGDLADATLLGRAMVQSSASDGAASPLLLINPLHAINPHPDPTASPYFAGSRCFLNPLYLRVEEVNGADHPDVAPLIHELAGAGRALNREALVDRTRVWAAKAEALAAIWAGPGSREARHAVDAALTDPVLAAFAAYGVACEVHGNRWCDWPADLRHPGGSGWAELQERRRDRIGFHTWLQLLVQEQLDATQRTVPLVHDLAIGTDPNGFDAWYWQHLFVLDGTHIGAPPDEFNTQGQDWGLPPMDPDKLRAAAYEPFVRMLRANLSHAAGLRMDHVMGLFRLFWVPPGAGPKHGTYVRQPASDLLDLVALESSRAGSFVVGEDLGTVEAGVREELAARRILTYKVMELDEEPPRSFPETTVASFATHDLATVPGLWTGSDLAAQQRLDLKPNVEGTIAARERVQRWAGASPSSPLHDVVQGVYAALAQAPSQIVLGALEDALGVEERPNMPGTIDQWPNWCQTLPLPLEQVVTSPAVEHIAATLAHRGAPPT